MRVVVPGKEAGKEMVAKQRKTKAKRVKTRKSPTKSRITCFRVAAKPPADPDAIVHGRCDFVLAIVKGLVEHDDRHAYFGSIMGFGYHEDDGIRRGLLCRVQKQCSDPGLGTIITTGLTDAGREAYHTARLHLLPNKYGWRAYTWDWSLEARGFR